MRREDEKIGDYFGKPGNSNQYATVFARELGKIRGSRLMKNLFDFKFAARKDFG